MPWRVKDEVSKWWLATQTLRRRVEAPDFGPAEDFPPSTTAELEYLGRRTQLVQIDIELYVVALWRLRKAVVMGRDHLEGGAALEQPLAAFDAAVPGLETLIDVTASFDEYHTGGGRFPAGARGLYLTGRPVPVDDSPRDEVGIGWHECELRVGPSADAARILQAETMAVLRPLL